MHLYLWYIWWDEYIRWIESNKWTRQQWALHTFLLSFLNSAFVPSLFIQAYSQAHSPCAYRHCHNIVSDQDIGTFPCCYLLSDCNRLIWNMSLLAFWYCFCHCQGWCKVSQVMGWWCANRQCSKSARRTWLRNSGEFGEWLCCVLAVLLTAGIFPSLVNSRGCVVVTLGVQTFSVEVVSMTLATVSAQMMMISHIVVAMVLSLLTVLGAATNASGSSNLTESLTASSLSCASRSYICFMCSKCSTDPQHLNFRLSFSLLRLLWSLSLMLVWFQIIESLASSSSLTVFSCFGEKVSLLVFIWFDFQGR